MVIPIPVMYARDRSNNRIRDCRRQKNTVYCNPAASSAYAQPPPVWSNQPPPPYEPYGNSYLQPPTGLPEYSPQTSGNLNDRLHWQAIASSFDVAGPQIATPWAQEQGRRNSVHQVYRAAAPGNDCPIARGMNQGAAFCDRVAARLNGALSRYDGDSHDDPAVDPCLRELSLEYEEQCRGSGRQPQTRPSTDRQKSPAPGLVNFKKSWTYANSRLPPHLPPFIIYMPTWRLLCMAAKASQDVYQRPRSSEKEDYIDANWRHGTKAMVLKSAPLDDQNLIVFAIRGSQKNFIDWAVNFRPAPTAPTGFLDDAGNACHAGFLSVARSMIGPVAARLRQLLEQDPSRASSSLLITGHSAGGAVAALLYMHMLAKTVESELNILTGCFKRVHCVTFGAPPVSFLPLQKASGKRTAKSVFVSFVNEGDPIIRADKAYLFSLARLLATPTPSLQVPAPPPQSQTAAKTRASKMSRQKLKGGDNQLAAREKQRVLPRWSVPPATLSNAGSLVLLREKPGKPRPRAVEGVSTNDEQLRNVVFGDIAMHSMELYKQRIDELAYAAVTGQ